MESQVSTAPNSHITKAATQTNITDNVFDIPLRLPGICKSWKDKESNITFNKFKVKISFTILREDEINPQDRSARSSPEHHSQRKHPI
eukprot:5870755-Ditylum_brightwellii.AAC.1